MKKRLWISFSIVIAVALIGGFFYVRDQAYFSHGREQNNVVFNIQKGEGSLRIAADLESKSLISSRFYFWGYLKARGLSDKIYPGRYLLSGKMTIPEIAAIVTNPQKVYEQVLFKEGWTAKQMADELDVHGFDGAAFISLVKNPPEDMVSQFSVLSDKPAGASLEGYLFPDTYYFSREATPKGILEKILDNTQNKITSDMLDSINLQHKTVFKILTMASIIEKEVNKDTDRTLVSGLFWNRIKIGQPLQSDATLTYILGDNRSRHSIEETKVNSAYNTYVNKGLPPGPISNPGLSSILAAIYPKDSDYNYFLSDPATGNTVFAKTYAEHLANKARYGL